MSILAVPTLQSLLGEVRILLNIKDANNANWTSLELSNYINEGARLYFSECVLANEGYFTVQTGGAIPDLAVVANVETVALPSDCFQVKNVFAKVTNGYVLLPYRNNMTEGYSTQGGTSSQTYLPYYEFQGNNLVLRPTPNFSDSTFIRLEYIQFPDQMIWGGDTLTSQISPVFKQVLIMYAVYKAKLKESMVSGVAMHKVPEDNLAMLYKTFKDTIAKRSRNPQFVVPFNPETEG